MSVIVTMDGGLPASDNGPGGPGKPGAHPGKPVARRKLRLTPGGVTLGQDVGREAQKTAVAILDVLAGNRTPAQAAEALGLSLVRYFQLETRAMHALVRSCEARPRGPTRDPDKELNVLKRQYDKLQRELARQQTLVRMAQRTIGLAAPAKPPPGRPGQNQNQNQNQNQKKKHHRPTVRALKAAAHLQELQERAQQTAPATVLTVPEISESPDQRG
jgi:hypothetical protein